MCLITVNNITINTGGITGIEIEPMLSPYDRGKTRIIAPHPIHTGDVFSIFEGPKAQTLEVAQKIRKAWYLNTPIHIPESRALTEEERVEAFSEVYQNSDQLIYDGLSWLLYKTQKDILVAKKIIIHGSNIKENTIPDKRVYLGIDTDEGRQKTFDELSEIIPEEGNRRKILERLEGKFHTTVFPSVV